jgi:hypothetical protein
MKLFFAFVVMIGCGFSVLAADEEPEAAGEGSSAGLPDPYAKDYLIANSTISPDKKLAVIYPTLAAEEAAEDANHPERIKDHIVALQPFAVLSELQTKYPYFQNQNHGGISAEWSDDSSVALITLDGKWGPHDVFLLEFRDRKLARTTNVLAKAHDLLLPDYSKSKADPYNVGDACYIGNIFTSTVNDSPVLVNSNGRLGVATSSRRFKEEIKPMDKASEALLALKPVTFRYKKEIDPDGRAQFGLVAEEVEKVNPDLVVRDKEGKSYSVRYEQVNAMLLNEFLKAYRKIQEQEATITQLGKELETVIAHAKEQDSKIQKVSDRIEISKSEPAVVTNDR